jgi:hypothetical protein
MMLHDVRARGRRLDLPLEVEAERTLRQRRELLLRELALQLCHLREHEVAALHGALRVQHGIERSRWCP